MVSVCARTGLLALLVDLEALAELVSIGTLFVFFAVAAGTVWRRCVEPGGAPDQATKAAGRLGSVIAASLGASTAFYNILYCCLPLLVLVGQC